jgi:transcriptional regulator with XRE-family HTH domain
MQNIVTAAGSHVVVAPIAPSESSFWDDFFESLHSGYVSLRSAFKDSGLTQEILAKISGFDKSRISKILSGQDNLTVKTLARLGTAMGCRVVITFVPYEHVGHSNIFYATGHRPTKTIAGSGGSTIRLLSPNSALIGGHR